MGKQFKAGDVFEFDGTFSQAQVGNNTTKRLFSISDSGGTVDDHRCGWMDQIATLLRRQLQSLRFDFF